MRRLFPLCALVVAIVSQTPLVFAQSNYTESLTITTYYPSPYGVYRNLKLNPTDTVPLGPALSAGVMYYNKSDDVIKYYNIAGNWVNLTGGSGGGGGGGGWNERADHSMNNTNLGKVIIGGNFAPPNGEALGVSGDMRVMHEPPGDGNTLLYISRWGSSNTAGLNFDTWTGPTDKYHLGIIGSPSRFRIDNGTTDFLTVTNVGNVGIGTTTPLVPLQVESKTLTSPLILRSAVGTADQSGAAAITPYGDYLWLTYGCYVKDDGFEHDAYHSSKKNCKLSISPAYGVLWYASSNAPADYWDLTTNATSSSVRMWTKTGTLEGASSRLLKENFIRINPDEILQKIDQLEVSRWNFKAEDKSVTHIGPVAEDFHRIFKTGDTESNLALTDSSGVSLAGVKALLKKVNMQQQQIEKLQAEMEELKSILKK